MNLASFNKYFDTIEQIFAYTKYKVKYEKSFSEAIRSDFNWALNSLSSLLDQDVVHMQKSREMWQTAHRIVKLDEVYVKINKIRDSILKLPGPKYFCNKLKDEVLPKLVKRINDLFLFIATNHRLPFTIGSQRDSFYQEAKKAIDFADHSKLWRIEKEYFHFLGDHLDKNKLKDINTDAYDGNLEIYSLMSWAKILEAFIQEGDETEKRIGQYLLNIINQAMPIANKLSFLFLLPNLQELDKVETEIAYFKDLARLRPNRSVANDHQKMTSEEFFSKYTLEQPCAVPLRVLENEIIWDILEIIDQMKEGESQAFTFGTKDHSITVQLICFERPSFNHSGDYKYEIFNTGEGVSEFQNIEEKEGATFARPLTYYNVSKKALSYSFFASLVRHRLLGETARRFYELHDQYLIKEGGAQKAKDLGYWYLIQNFGTCTYRTVEAWIDSYLNEKQIKHLELIKTRLSTEKQRKVVYILENEVKKESGWMTISRPKNYGKPKAIPSQVWMTKTTKLNESRTLLQLGEEHLNKLSNPSL
jgi:hypothetical protein